MSHAGWYGSREFMMFGAAAETWARPRRDHPTADRVGEVSDVGVGAGRSASSTARHAQKAANTQIGLGQPRRQPPVKVFLVTIAKVPP
jgi:hypothetical protein